MKRIASEVAYPKQRVDVTIEPYQEGRMMDWCAIQVESGHVDTITEAKGLFEKTFLASTFPLQEHIFFLRHKNGEIIGSIALWEDTLQGVMMKRLHWLAIKDAYAHQGFADYLVAMLCAICKEDIFLSTQTWSYPAIHLYLKHGFQPYNPYGEADYEIAWSVIDEVLSR